jgi:hypothetical protein
VLGQVAADKELVAASRPAFERPETLLRAKLTALLEPSSESARTWLEILAAGARR